MLTSSAHPGEDPLAISPDYDDSDWRNLYLPHDWSIEGTFSKDNGCQASPEPFKAHTRIAFHGKCLVVIQSSGSAGKITLRASSQNLISNAVILKAK